MSRAELVEALLASDEPAICWRVLVGALGLDPASQRAQSLQEQIRSSPRSQALVARLADGNNVYAKWQGAHWSLVALADMGYPAGDAALIPVRDQVQSDWLDDGYYTEFQPTSKAQAYRQAGVPVMNGRYRAHASQQGNTLYAVTQLGLADENTARLVERLLQWQWPDGGWNCDRHPDADTSSFMETLTPLRGLAAYARAHHDQRALDAAHRAAEVFLTRHLFRRRSDGQVIHPDFVQLHYPLYWHYDILGGLKVLAELGVVTDPRCTEALDVLERKELPTGGWPAEKRYYHVSNDVALYADHVDWGGASKRRPNAWVTTDALYVLRAAGRM